MPTSRAQAGELFWFYNATSAPPATLELAATQLEQLVTITGAGSARGESGKHVTDVTLRGLKLTSAALSYLSPHGLPSARAVNSFSCRPLVLAFGAIRITRSGLQGNDLTARG